jgi:hypothetical protein
MKMGFKFQLPPRTVRFLIYGTINCVYDCTVHKNEELTIRKQNMYGAGISGKAENVGKSKVIIHHSENTKPRNH